MGSISLGTDGFSFMYLSSIVETWELLWWKVFGDTEALGTGSQKEMCHAGQPFIGFTEEVWL